MVPCRTYSQRRGCEFGPTGKFPQGQIQKLAFISPDLGHSHNWGSFPSGFCWKHMETKTLARAAGAKYKVGTSNRSKSLRRKGLGKDTCGGIRAFYNLLCTLGHQEAYMPSVGCILRKGLRKTSKYSPLADHQALQNRKWKLRQGCKQPGKALNTDPMAKTGDHFCPCFPFLSSKYLKKLFQTPTDHY